MSRMSIKVAYIQELGKWRSGYREGVLYLTMSYAEFSARSFSCASCKSLSLDNWSQTTALVIFDAVDTDVSVTDETNVNLPTIKPNIEAYTPRNSESGSYIVVCWRHTVNLKQAILKTNKYLGVSLCQLRHRWEKTQTVRTIVVLLNDVSLMTYEDDSN
jgi:hypothetical protein